MLYRCYAKVNFTLEILGRRTDGYHDLLSLVHTISLADDLRIEPAPSLLGHVEGLELDPEQNLVLRAAQLLTSTAGASRGAELALRKRTPAAAGLGGGSSDAATALVGLNAVWGCRLDTTSLLSLAARLGTDVPFFVRGGAALMAGRGDELRPLPPLDSQWLVLLVPSHALADKTARLYRALEPSDFSTGEATRQVARRLEQRLGLDGSDLPNGFGRAARAVFPGLAELWQTAEQRCERRFMLSGAGPSLFALAADRADAVRQTRRLADLEAATSTARTVRRARRVVRTTFAAAARMGYP